MVKDLPLAEKDAQLGRFHERMHTKASQIEGHLGPNKSRA